MLDRSNEIQRFLKASGWGDAASTALAGDMSTRRYFRLKQGRVSAILMDADTSMAPFLAMTEWLAQLDLSVPQVFAAEPDDGLLILEELGDVTVKKALSDRLCTDEDIFAGCVDILLRIRRAEPPPLQEPSAKELVAWTELADHQLPGVKPNALDAFRSHLLTILSDVIAGTATVSLRDFHTENMMWLPDRQGCRKFGLLDYQDAILTHPAYDLMSLLTDARTWVPGELRRAVVAQYLQKSGDDRDQFELAFAALSAQRNLRIMGLFARSGKHLECLPNTYRYFIEALDHPAFEQIKTATIGAVPQPT
ncbi:MAG: phosphotransferase [Pseudomonadota bacterium]